MTISRAEFELMQSRCEQARAGGVQSASLVCRPDACRDESKLHQEILEWCAAQWPRWLAFHGSMAHATHRPPGEPDFIIAAPNGRTLWIECKAKAAKQTLEQKAIQMQLDRLGHTYHLVYSFEQFLEITKL